MTLFALKFKIGGVDEQLFALRFRAFRAFRALGHLERSERWGCR